MLAPLESYDIARKALKIASAALDGPPDKEGVSLRTVTRELVEAVRRATTERNRILHESDRAEHYQRLRELALEIEIEARARGKGPQSRRADDVALMLKEAEEILAGRAQGRSAWRYLRVSPWTEEPPPSDESRPAIQATLYLFHEAKRRLPEVRKALSATGGSQHRALNEALARARKLKLGKRGARGAELILAAVLRGYGLSDAWNVVKEGGRVLAVWNKAGSI